MAVGNLNKDTKVYASGLQVDKNVIYYQNSAINANNISLISISPSPANNSWIAAIVVAIIGLLMGFESGGWVLLLGAIIWIIAVVIHNNNRGEYLAINLNSGNTLYFYCKERHFLNQVISVMVECIKSGSESYTIRLDKCVINPGIAGDISVS